MAAHTVQEVGPALVRVLAPSLRAMAPNLLTHGEHDTVRHTTAVMVDYGLCYSTEDGQLAGESEECQPCSCVCVCVFEFMCACS